MTQINTENSMILNSKLISNKVLEIDSKIFHFVLPQTSNLKVIPNFAPKKILGQSLKHLVNCCKEDLIKNPVFFSLISIETLDDGYIKRFEITETIAQEEIKLLRENYDKSIELICKLMDKKLSGLDFGKKFWSISDLDSLKL